MKIHPLTVCREKLQNNDFITTNYRKKAEMLEDIIAEEEELRNFAAEIYFEISNKILVRNSKRRELPKSKLSKAFHYALNNREGFWNYLEDGNCSISNSLAENCIRPFVIGRKNWLFSGSPKGAEASAGIYTLFYLTLTAKA